MDPSNGKFAFNNTQINETGLIFFAFLLFNHYLFIHKKQEFYDQIEKKVKNALAFYTEEMDLCNEDSLVDFMHTCSEYESDSAKLKHRAFIRMAAASHTEVYFIQCTVMQYIVYSILFLVYCIQSVVYCIQYIVYSIWLCSIPYIVYSLQSVVYSIYKLCQYLYFV